MMELISTIYLGSLSPVHQWGVEGKRRAVHPSLGKSGNRLTLVWASQVLKCDLSVDQYEFGTEI